MITIVEVNTESLDEVKQAMGKLIEQLGYTPSKPRIFLKPNAVDALPPNHAVDVDPIVSAGLILALNDKFDIEEFVIGENSGYFSENQKLFNASLKHQVMKKWLRI